MSLRRLLFLSLGGTITMVPSDGGGIAPKLGAAELVASVPDLAKVAAIDAESPARLEFAFRNAQQRTTKNFGFIGCVVQREADRRKKETFAQHRPQHRITVALIDRLVDPLRQLHDQER